MASIFTGRSSLSSGCSEQLQYGLEQIRATLGPVEQSGITDQDIKDTLYHYYFDIEQSLNWLIGELHPVCHRPAD